MILSPHPAAQQHLPLFITAPGDTDILLIGTGVVLVAGVLAAGVFFLWLHSLPERMVHNKVQFDIVAVLALLSLFTHIHAFWIAALLLALVKFPQLSFPNLSKPLTRIAASLERLAAPEPKRPVPNGSPLADAEPNFKGAD